MSRRDTEKLLVDALEPIAEREGFELVAVFVTGQTSNPTVSVLLDTPDGIDLEQLAAANRWVEEAVEGGSAISGAYTLEVSSPGIDRPLRKRADFERFVDSEVIVKTPPSPGERAVWRGTLKGLAGDDVVIVDERGDEHHVPFVDIVSAHIKGVIDFSGNERD